MEGLSYSDKGLTTLHTLLPAMIKALDLMQTGAMIGASTWPGSWCIVLTEVNGTGPG